MSRLFAEGPRGTCAMRVLGFPLVPELGDGALFAVWDEHRVEAEAFGAARCERDAARERAGAAQLLAVGVERHELGDVTRTTRVAVHAFERAQHPPDLVTGGAPGRPHARPAVEAGHLDPGVLTDDQGDALRTPTRELRLGSRVFVVRRAGLRRVIVGVE